MKGCHCVVETSGTWMKTHWPALYFMLGLWNWISMASGSLDVTTAPLGVHTVWMADHFGDSGLAS